MAVTSREPGFEPADIPRLLRRGVRGVVRAARVSEPTTLSRVLREHIGEVDGDPAVVVETWPAYEHINVAVAIDAWLEEPKRASQLLGVVGGDHRSFGLAELLRATENTPEGRHYGPFPGSIARVNLSCGPEGQVRPCVRVGLYLVAEGGQRTGVLFSGGQDPDTGAPLVSVQVASTVPEFAAQAARDIRRLAVEHNVFRGHVLSFGGDVFSHRGGAIMQFHSRPTMASSELILDADVLAAVKRQVVDVARHRQQLLAAGQHLKRGALLYGPPGVGKTHTVRYLMSMLTGTTVIQLTGTALGLISEACSVARTLQPAMLIVEDVDLIAEDRGMRSGQHPLLFQLLNEMDGLAEDSDVVFLLTTNRADLLEPALAARPGRVDQAVELKLPDESARRQLFDLYRGSLVVDVSGLDDIIERTEGVTASFLKELLRRAAVMAAEYSDDSDDALKVSAANLSEALDELLATRNAMTRTLLGGGRISAGWAAVAPGQARS